MDETTLKIKQFIVDEFMPDVSVDELDSDFDLLTGGVVDSLGLLQMVAWLETEFDVAVDTSQLGPESFRTVDARTRDQDRVARLREQNRVGRPARPPRDSADIVVRADRRDAGSVRHRLRGPIRLPERARAPRAEHPALRDEDRRPVLQRDR